MKKLILLLFVSFIFFVPPKLQAQGMMGQWGSEGVTNTASESATAVDEAKGKIIYEKLQSKQTTCQSLTDDDFDVLGDYFMGQRLGNTTTHAVMNSMMTRMMGEEGEKQMHVSLGKRLSGCDPSAPISSQGSNFLPMMGWGGMMGYSSNFTRGGGNPMMGYRGWDGFGFGFIPMFLFWALVILGLFLLLKNLSNTRNSGSANSPLEILKQRYAKGEIDKKEFESVKKDLA